MPCGDKSYTEIRYDEAEFKFLSARVLGTEEHADRYGGSRSRNEAYHALWKAPETGNLRPEVFDLLGLARVGLLVTVSAIVTNIRSLKAFDEARRRNDGQAPYEDRRALREARRARAHAYRGRSHARPKQAKDEPPDIPINPMLVLGDRRRKPKHK